MDGTFGSIAVMVAVMVRCVAAVAPGFAPAPGVTASFAVSTAASPAGFLRTTTLLKNRAVIVSPTLISEKRVMVLGTVMGSYVPSVFLTVSVRVAVSIASTVAVM